MYQGNPLDLYSGTTMEKWTEEAGQLKRTVDEGDCDEHTIEQVHHNCDQAANEIAKARRGMKDLPRDERDGMHIPDVIRRIKADLDRGVRAAGDGAGLEAVRGSFRSAAESMRRLDSVMNRMLLAHAHLEVARLHMTEDPVEEAHKAVSEMRERLTQDGPEGDDEPSP